MTVVGNGATGFSGDNGPAIKAQLNTPDGVAIAPDGDLIVADSHNDRIRRVDKPTRIITTIAGSGENGYDGDEKPAIEAALNTPNAVFATRNGDIYIADTLNNRIRVIDHDDRPHPHGGRRRPDRRRRADRRRRPGDQRAPVHAERRGGGGQRRHLHRRHAPQPRSQGRRQDAASSRRSPATASFGSGGDDGPATEARLAGPAGIALVPEAGGRMTIFIADYYNAFVRAVGPDGIMRNVTRRGSRASRVRRRGWPSNRVARLPLRRGLEQEQYRRAEHSENAPCAHCWCRRRARPPGGPARRAPVT